MTLQTSYPALGLGPFAHAVRKVEPGTYEAVPDLDYAGQWVMQVCVRVDQFTSVPVQFTVHIP